MAWNPTFFELLWFSVNEAAMFVASCRINKQPCTSALKSLVVMVFIASSANSTFPVSRGYRPSNETRETCFVLFSRSSWLQYFCLLASFNLFFFVLSKKNVLASFFPTNLTLNSFVEIFKSHYFQYNKAARHNFVLSQSQSRLFPVYQLL